MIQFCVSDSDKATMNDSCEFYKSIIDAMTEHIVVIDQQGAIRYVNNAWMNFGQQNGYLNKYKWQQMNYLTICDASADAGERFAGDAAQGIRKVIAGDQSLFYLEYPCHSITEKRWFMMRTTPLELKHQQLFVISHQNITERKLAEIEAMSLSRIDGLTGIANRRYFDEHLESEWKRCERLQMPLSLILLDLDYFKLYNDTYGHVAGDKCLQEVGRILHMFGKRPGDISARYGGEEFAVILSNAQQVDVEKIARRLLEAIRNRSITFTSSPLCSFLTASMGVATIYPNKNMEASTLVAIADASLYSAKNNGRNRIVASCSSTQ